LDGLHTPLHNDPNNNVSNPQLRNAVNSQSIPVRITSRNQQRANRKKPLQKHKKNVSRPNDNSQWPNRKVSIPHYNQLLVIIKTIILTNRFFV
jgi:hypothetical protein